MKQLIKSIIVALALVVCGCARDLKTPEAAIKDLLELCFTSGRDKYVRDLNTAKTDLSDGHSVIVMVSFRFDGRQYAGAGPTIYAACIVRENGGDWNEIEFTTPHSGLGKKWKRNCLGWWSEKD